MFDKINKKFREDNNEVKSEAKKFVEGCSKKAGGMALLFTSLLGLFIAYSEMKGRKNNDKKRNF